MTWKSAWLKIIRIWCDTCANMLSDMPHDTDYPYPIRILAFFSSDTPYSILIRILNKFMEKLFLTTLCPCHRAVGREATKTASIT